MVEFNKIHSQYKDKGFKLLAISTDAEKTVAKVKPYIKSKGYDFTVLFDTNGDVPESITRSKCRIQVSWIKTEILFTRIWVI